MGFKRHITLKCHTCKRRDAVGGTKKSGSWRKDGWKMVRLENSGHYVLLCPTCARRKEGSVRVAKR
jgi:hypothetical protein